MLPWKSNFYEKTLKEGILFEVIVECATIKKSRGI